jgi:hypothetical protein
MDDKNFKSLVFSMIFILAGIAFLVASLLMRFLPNPSL